MKRLLAILFTFGTLLASAQKVDTVAVHSSAMNKEIKNVVILPAGYGTQVARRYPVVYLLHGYSGNYAGWATKPDLARIASGYDMIVVCPDGGYNSWYWDSPVDPAVRYETYVSGELVRYVDTHYRTAASPAGRAVTGLSMGGHGGLWLGFRHQDTYGACGSMCGGVDITPFPDNWDMKKQLGEYAANRRVWDEHSVINQLHLLRSGDSPAIIIDCGTSDFFFEVNEALHRKLLYNNIPHDYISRPGSHNAAYWNSAVDYQLLFFRKFFDKAEKK